MSRLLDKIGFTGTIATAAIAAGLAISIGHGGIVAPAAAEKHDASEGAPVLKSVSLELPASARTFPDGPGAAAINNNCLVCHSAGMVLNQPAMSETAWAGEVHKMISVYKAPVSDQDAAVIVAYLTWLKGSGASAR
jgi:hypothetical protein